MLDRLILSAVLGVTGWNGLYPAEPPTPPMQPTAFSLQQKAKARSVSAVCERKSKQKQSKTVQKMCKRWESRRA